jgi:hypothetical protein
MFQGSHKTALILFWCVYFFSGLSRIGTSFDSQWSVYIAVSLWQHGDTNLDEYRDAIRRANSYSILCVDGAGGVRVTPTGECVGHLYDVYPVAGPVLESPLIMAAIGVMKLLHPVLGHFHSQLPPVEGFFRGDYGAGHAVIEMEVASALLAASTVMMFLIALRFLAEKRALVLAIFFATGTSAYSVAGRGLWQHAPSMLLLTIIIYLLMRAEERPELAGWAGLPVALSYMVRPTDSLFVVIFTFYVAVRHRRQLGWFLLAAAPVAAVFIAYNLSVYHYIFSPYYRTDLPGLLPSHWGRWGVGLRGTLFSPSRGLLIYTPIFLLAVWSMIRRKWRTPLAPWLAVLALAQWLTVSAYTRNWWGGHSYGPRFFTDVTPVFVLFLIPYLKNWERSGRALRVGIIILAAMSCAIHLRGGWSEAVYRWNVDPANIDEHPEHNWDWRDPQFLRVHFNRR